MLEIAKDVMAKCFNHILTMCLKLFGFKGLHLKLIKLKLTSPAKKIVERWHSATQMRYRG